MKTLQEIEALIKLKENLIGTLQSELDELYDARVKQSFTISEPIIREVNEFNYIVTWNVGGSVLHLTLHKEHFGWKIFGIVPNTIQNYLPYLPDEILEGYEMSKENCILVVDQLLRNHV